MVVAAFRGRQSAAAPLRLDPIAAGPRAGKRVGALASGLAVLRYLNAVGLGVGVNRVARDLGLNPSTCYNLLRTLVDEGLVSFDPQAKTYAVGLGLVELARGALEQAGFARLVRPHLEAVADAHGVTATLWQRSGPDRVVLVDHCEAEAAMRLHMQIGQRLPVHVAALGRCMAAHSGLGRQALRDAFRKLRWENAPTFEDYHRSVRLAGERGWAVDRGQFVEGVASVSAAVLDAQGSAIMALSASGFAARLTDRRVQAIGADLRIRADAVARALSGGDPGNSGAMRADGGR